MQNLVFLCLVAVVAADRSAKIANYQYGIEEDGSYAAEYETTNGISASEEGISYPGAVPESGNYVRNGQFSYEWEGVTYTVKWTADENGFHPEGAHLPDYSHLVLLCLLAVVAADRSAKIANYQYGIEEDGSYAAEYETTNGISASEEGISYPGAVPESGNYVRSGSFSYEWEGVTYTVVWTADENGFHPKGDHLPGDRGAINHIGDFGEIEQ